MKRRENDLGNDSVGTLLRRLAIPAIAAQLVNALYNIVDRMYIGHIPEVGDLALTGVGLCFPLIIFVSAFACFSSLGGAPRASVRMGEGKVEEANRILGTCVAFLLLTALVVGALMYIVKEPLLYLFGASENTIGYAMDYLGIYLFGTFFTYFYLGLNNFITIQGFSTTSMCSVLLGAVVNIILDPIFIFGFGMGVRGAAIATIISQLASAIWVVSFLRGKRSKLSIQRQNIRIDKVILLSVMALGSSSFVMQTTESMVNIVLNASISRYGGDTAVGAMTICISIINVFFMPLMGFAQGAQPIMGFNYGAGKLDRVRHTFRLLITCCLTVSIVGWLVIQFVPGLFVMCFTDDPALMEVTLWALPIYMAGTFMLGVMVPCQQTFVVLGQAKTSLLFALVRKVFLLIPLVLLLPRIFGHDQVFFVLVSEPIADILAATAVGCFFAYRFPRLLKERALFLEKERAKAATNP